MRFALGGLRRSYYRFSTVTCLNGDGAMYVIDDSMFALLLRFVGREQEIKVCDREFLEQQLEAIRTYVEAFPAEERQMRAMEWIETYSRRYRKRFEKLIVKQQGEGQRCPDCPMADVSDLETCQIHREWLELLQQYVADELDSKQYVKDSLELLNRHKEDLKFKLTG